MKKSYNKSIRFNNYSIGDKVWLRNKSFKPGQSAKLAPRRSGPWSIIEVLPNKRNFRVKNDSNGKTKVIHHDRIAPVRSTVHESESEESSSEVEEEEEENESADSDVHDEPIDQQHRYPRRNRIPRRIPGAIPWDAIENESEEEISEGE